MRIWKNLLHRHGEGRRDPIGEVERRVVTLGLERVDGLAGDSDRRGELLLGPFSLRPEDSQSALHACELWMKGVTIPNAPQNSG